LLYLCIKLLGICIPNKEWMSIRKRNQTILSEFDDACEHLA